MIDQETKRKLFEAWLYVGDKCDIREFEHNGNHKYDHCKESFNAALDLMAEREEKIMKLLEQSLEANRKTAWYHDRLINLYAESANLDYHIKTRELLAKIESELKQLGGGE
jgi:RNA polymerase-binding transcription factor DksA